MLKSQRQNYARYLVNTKLKQKMKMQYKVFLKTIVSDKEKASAMLPLVQKAFAKAAKKGIIKKNKMNRKISAAYSIFKKTIVNTDK